MPDTMTLSQDVTQDDILTAVRESAMLVDVTIGVWGATRTDSALMEEVKEAHGAKGDVGRVIKNLMAGAEDEFKATRSAFIAVRLRHYALTLPWVSDPHSPRKTGPRLLPHMINQRYMTEMFALKRAAFEKLDGLCDMYPTLVKTAQANLNTMVDATQYPSVDQLRNLFRIHFEFTPVPDGASFKGLPQLTLDRLGAQLARRHMRQLGEANREIFIRAEQPLRNMIERLDADSFREATLDNVREIVNMMQAWNVTNDPEITDMIEEISELMDGADSKQLRKSEKTRQGLVDRAREVADKLRTKAQA